MLELMILYTSITLLLVTFIFFPKKSNFPPGPWRLPLFGNVTKFGKFPHYGMARYSKIYGPIVGFQAGPLWGICIHGAKLIAEAFNEPAFTGRHNNKAFQFVLGEPGGIINSTGDVWVEQRRFALRHLRDVGFGKSSMEELIMDEVNDVTEWLKQQNGKAVPLQKRFKLAVVNSLWRIFAGERLDHNDQKLQNILDDFELTSNTLGRLDSFKSLVIILYPDVVKRFLNWSSWNHLERINEKINQLFRQIINEHIVTLPEGSPRDFIDIYLQKVMKSSNTDSSFHPQIGQESLRRVMWDFFFAGTDTTSATLSWAMLYLLHYPEVQKKLQKELDVGIGRSRHPCLSDRKNLPYTEAVILETLRFSTIVPGSIPHCSTADVKFHGYDIPKGTMIFANLYEAHFDPEVWGDPELFRPERFLSPDGTTINKHDGLLIPFSVGRRVCVGETLAKDTLFLFVANLAHTFEVIIPPGIEKPPLQSVQQAILGPFSSTVAMKERYPGELFETH